MASREITYAEAIREGLREEMKRDERIILMGEDIKINVWTVTRGLFEEFGDRVINMPLSESGFSGAAVGAALTGMRPESPTATCRSSRNCAPLNPPRRTAGAPETTPRMRLSPATAFFTKTPFVSSSATMSVEVAVVSRVG